MDDPQLARKRLEQAIVRVERAAEKSGEALKIKLKAAQAERERLSAVVQQLQADNAALRAVTEATAARIERLIESCETLLRD
jgi:predicted metalloenzyme YecM